MPRTFGQLPTATRAATAIVRRAVEQGGSAQALLAAFARFVARDDGQLGNAAQRLSSDEQRRWSDILAAFPALPQEPFGARQQILREIAEYYQPVSAAGLLFELVWRCWDPADRRRRGAYSTPQPLVDLLLRAAAELAVESFPAGEAFHVVDPACGYGAFLRRAGDWFPSARTTGIEICPATASVAQLLAALEAPTRDLRFTLVNPLAAGDDLRELVVGTAERPLVPIIMGNPPWANFGRRNGSAWIRALLADYRTGLAERKSNLADDAIKFIRWGQYWIQAAGAGILALVTPRTWLEGLTQRGMRRSLLDTFDRLEIVDFSGDGHTPADENVFGVRSGVAAVVLVREARCAAGSGVDRPRRYRYVRVPGSRAEKLAAARAFSTKNASACELTPAEPDWRLAPSRVAFGGNLDLSPPQGWPPYESCWPLDKIFQQFVSGVQTKNDAVFVGFTREALSRQVQDWLRRQQLDSALDAAHIRPYLVAPFDRRLVYYDPKLLGRARLSVMRHLLESNLGLVFMRQSTSPGEYDHFLAVDTLVSDRVFYSRHGAPYLAPLWLAADQPGGDRAANFTAPFLAAVAERLDCPPDPRELFDYLYAVAFSPPYRARYAAELGLGFPRIPLPREIDWYRGLAEIGRRLVDLHLGREPMECDSGPVEAAVSDEDRPFRLGGYDVIARWTRPRCTRGRNSDFVSESEMEFEIARLRTIGRETRRLQRELERRLSEFWR
jgi:predicted helicase